MIVDILIVLFLLSSLARGREIGFIRQLLSAVGFFGGLAIGILLERHFIHLATTTESRAIVTLILTLGSTMAFLSVGEYIGVMIKRKLMQHRIDGADVVVGAVAGGLTLLLTVWLVMPVLVTLPFPSLQNAIKSSVIVGELNSSLPSVPTFISSLGRLIDPNGFPQVFNGLEPSTSTNVPLPSLGTFTTAVQKDAASVVKIEGQGCGGIVEGSGFIAASGLVITNAHVVAGVANPYIVDSAGQHHATAIWFDPNLDLAVLRTTNLAGKPLSIDADRLANQAGAAALGYPGGGGFSAKAATVIEEFTATGQNIYGQGNTTRDVYEIKADIIPGNSGGPLIDQGGAVRGIVFAQSTTYKQVGYALAMQQVVNEFHQAQSQNESTTTGTCAE